MIDSALGIAHLIRRHDLSLENQIDGSVHVCAMYEDAYTHEQNRMTIGACLRNAKLRTSVVSLSIPWYYLEEGVHEREILAAAAAGYDRVAQLEPNEVDVALMNLRSVTRHHPTVCLELCLLDREPFHETPMVELTHLVSLNQGDGAGRKVLQLLCETADEHGIGLHLQCDDRGTGKLQSLYESVGFQPQEGMTMVRLPQRVEINRYAHGQRFC